MSSSSASFAPLGAALGLPVTEKLSKSNHVLWKASVLPAIRAAQRMGYLDGSKKAPPEFLVSKKGTDEVKDPNPDYAAWVAKDQQVLGYLPYPLVLILDIYVTFSIIEKFRTRFLVINFKHEHWEKATIMALKIQIHVSKVSFYVYLVGLNMWYKRNSFLYSFASLGPDTWLVRYLGSIDLIFRCWL